MGCRKKWEVLHLSGLAGKGILSVAISADGKRIASGSTDNTVLLSDAESGQKLLTLKGHIGPVTAAVFTADGKAHH